MGGPIIGSMKSASGSTVLLVEDDAAVRELLVFHLEKAGFTVLQAGSTREAEELLPQADVMVLDWMLPVESGAQWLARRAEETDRGDMTPVLMLTARATENDKVHGLESGADDYLTKPFSTPELVARLRALLRRSGQPDTIRLGRLTVHPDQGTAELGGTALTLTRREFDLLSYLATNSGRVCSRNELLDRVWGEEFLGTERTVDQHVAQLRAHLGNDWIVTVRGRGYRLQQVDDAAA